MHRNAILALCLTGLITTSASSAAIDIVKSRDVNVKIWNTVFGVKVGGPIVDIDLPAGNKLHQPDNLLLDLAVKQTFLPPAPNAGVAVNQAAAAIVPDLAHPGQVTMQPMNEFLLSNYGIQPDHLPDLAVSQTNSFFDVFASIDMSQWNGLGPAPPLGSTFTFNNGTSPALPGVQVGLAPITFDPILGWVNPAPYTGTVFELGNIDVRAPEPSALMLAGLGIVFLLGPIRSTGRRFRQTCS
jgi:hypothetical protein